jgi:hypothetical protein
MSPLLIKISKDFATLFTTSNPIATVALFAGFGTHWVKEMVVLPSLIQPSPPLRRSRQPRRDG